MPRTQQKHWMRNVVVDGAPCPQHCMAAGRLTCSTERPSLLYCFVLSSDQVSPTLISDVQSVRSLVCKHGGDGCFSLSAALPCAMLRRRRAHSTSANSTEICVLWGDGTTGTTRKIRWCWKWRIWTGTFLTSVVKRARFQIKRMHEEHGVGLWTLTHGS